MEDHVSQLCEALKQMQTSAAVQNRNIGAKSSGTFPGFWGDEGEDVHDYMRAGRLSSWDEENLALGDEMIQYLGVSEWRLRQALGQRDTLILYLQQPENLEAADNSAKLKESVLASSGRSTDFDPKEVWAKISEELLKAVNPKEKVYKEGRVAKLVFNGRVSW